MRRLMRIASLTVVAALFLLASACDDSDSSGTPNGTSEPQASATPAITPATSVPTATPPEDGEAPISWRTADDFASVTANEDYKMLIRVTNGYDEATITIEAICTSCGSDGDVTATFTGNNVTPVGDEGPGAFYPTSLNFPQAGRWQMTVHAGEDEAVIPLEVQEAA